MADKIQESGYYHTKIKDWPHAERPREKLCEFGASHLSDAELLALLIGSGTKRVTALDLAKRMLIDSGHIENLASKNVIELTKMKGIGNARGARIAAAFELGRRQFRKRFENKIQFKSPDDIAAYYGPKVNSLKYEVFALLLLNGNNCLIQEVQLTKGTLTASLVHPREVFKAAIDYMAAALILIHNHPSGEPKPSDEDKKITRQLLAASELIGIPILDHVIISNNQYFSFTQKGLIKQRDLR